MTLQDAFLLHAYALTTRLLRRYLRYRVTNYANDNSGWAA